MDLFVEFDLPKLFNRLRGPNQRITNQQQYKLFLFSFLKLHNYKTQLKRIDTENIW